VIVDANILLYAVDERSPHNRRAVQWLEGALNSRTRIGFPWASIGAFLRISTHPRVSDHPLSPQQAWQFVEEWLRPANAWIPAATDRTAGILGDLIRALDITANLIPDAQLAAIAIENGVAVVSADTDFARFPQCTWINPLDP
jgi:toxin-antitoxin system PIN domain toxin